VNTLGVSGQRPCFACQMAVWFSRMWTGGSLYTEPVAYAESVGWYAIERCPHCSESLAEFAPLTGGFPESPAPPAVNVRSAAGAARTQPNRTATDEPGLSG
jgi:hypothetical protein